MLTLRCFGGVSVQDDAGTELALRSRKHLGLFLYLVAHRRTTHSREDLAELLWSGSGARARHSLSQALYDIRSTLGLVVDVSTRTVQIEERVVAYEAERFERAVESGDHDTALDLYRGDYAPNLINVGADAFDRWVDGESERQRVLASIALRNAQRSAEERGDWDRMCLAALRLIRTNEFDEEAHCALMRGLWMKGDPASALRHHRALTRRGHAQHWRAVADLAARLERSGTANELVAVPPRPVELVGRERQFEELFSLLERRTAPVGTIAISGERGVGKTAFLVEFARLAEVRGRAVSWLSRWGEDPSDLGALDRPGALDRAGPGARPGVAVVDRNEAPLMPIASEAARYRRPLTIVMSTREGAPAGAAEIHLGRLTPRQTATLVTRRFPDAGPAAAEIVASLSGGNPALAIELSHTFDGHGWPDHARPVTDAGAMALARSSSLRTLVDAFLAALTEPELEVARTLALLTPPARELADRLFETDRAKRGLAGLRRRGWLRDDGGACHLAHRMLAIALSQGSGFRERRELHESAATLLRDGGPAERYAAASEMVAAGQNEAAYALAQGAAREALANGDNMTAALAAGLSESSSRSPEDRFRSGMIRVEADLSRGRHPEASATLRRLQDSALCLEDRVRVRIGLLRASMGIGAVRTIRRVSAELQSDISQAANPPLGEVTQLVLSQVRLWLARRERSDTAPCDAAALRDRLEAGRRTAAEHAPVWVEGFRHLFGYFVDECSAAAGKSAISRFAPTLAGLSDAGLSTLLTYRALLELRGGRPDEARRIYEHGLQERGYIADRTTSVLKNNLAVALMEGGNFDGARQRLAETSELDQILGLPWVDQITTRMNLAQSTFFLGKDADALATCRRVADVAEEHGLDSHKAQALALTGLLNLKRKEGAAAARIAEQLSAQPSTDGYTPDGYLVTWFTSAFRWQNERTHAKEELVAEAIRLRPYDELASAKLWLIAEAMVRGNGPPGQTAEAQRRIRIAGCSWFIRVANAWD